MPHFAPLLDKAKVSFIFVMGYVVSVMVYCIGDIGMEKLGDGMVPHARFVTASAYQCRPVLFLYYDDRILYFYKKSRGFLEKVFGCFFIENA